VVAPMAIRTLHPVVLLPAGLAGGVSDADLHAVAVHELAHVKRADTFLLSLASLVRAALFFHPLVWIACRRLSFLAEQAADDAVLDVTGQATPYARMLARMARRLRRRELATELAVGIVISKSALLQRVEAILSDRRDRIKKLSRWALAATAAGVAVSLLLAAGLPLGQKETTQDHTTVADEEQDKFIAQLPEGVTVELIGVCEHPIQGKEWWRPDGQELSGWPLKGMKDSLFDQMPHEQAYQFAFRVEGVDDAIRFEADDAGSRALRGYAASDGEELEHVRTLTTAFPIDRQTVDIRLGVASGGWDTIAEEAMPMNRAAHRPSRSSTDARSKIVFFGAYAGRRGTYVPVAHFYSDRNIRLIAIDNDGDVHVAGYGGTGLKVGMKAQTWSFTLALEKIKSIEFQTRPFHYVTFKNVSLRRGKKTKVEVVPEGKPELREEQAGAIDAIVGAERLGPDLGSRPARKVILNSGATAEVVGVGRLAGDKLEWWDADGGPTSVPGVVESDLNGFGTVIACRIRGTPDLVFKHYQREGREGDTVKQTRSHYAKAPGICIIEALDKTFVDLYLHITSGPWKTLVSVPIAAKDIGKKIEPPQRSLIEELAVDPLTPERFQVTIKRKGPIAGFSSRFAAADKAGKVHERASGAFVPGSATLTFEFPVGQLAAIVYQERPVEHAALRNIRLTPLSQGVSQGKAPTVEMDPVQETPKSRKILLPDVDRELVMLDLSSGELLPIPKVGGDEETNRAIKRLGKGDVVYDAGALICVGGARADAPPSEEKDTLLYYQLDQLPFTLLITTHQGRHFYVTILSADKNGCELEYVPVSSPAPDDPAAVMKAFADAVMESRYEDAVKYLSDEWIDVWGLRHQDYDEYLFLHRVLWRAARHEQVARRDTQLLDGLFLALRGLDSSKMEVRDGRASVPGQGRWFLLAKQPEGWKLALLLSNNRESVRAAYLHRRRHDDPLASASAFVSQFCLEMAAKRYARAQDVLIGEGIEVSGVGKSAQPGLNVIRKAATGRDLSETDKRLLAELDHPAYVPEDQIRGVRAIARGPSQYRTCLVRVDGTWRIACFRRQEEMDSSERNKFLESGPVEVSRPEKDATLCWSDPIERFVHDDGEEQDQLIDLDTGKLFSFPDDFASLSPLQQSQWFREQGVDAGAETADGLQCLYGLEIAVLQKPNDYWHHLSPDIVSELIPGPKASAPVVMSATGTLPATFAFKTREGATGIRQILEVVDTPPRGVRVRYKLVQGRGARAARAPIETGQSNPTEIDVATEAGKARTGLTVHSTPSEQPIGRKYTVVVVDEAGKPVAGTLVTLMSLGAIPVELGQDGRLEISPDGGPPSGDADPFYVMARHSGRNLAASAEVPNRETLYLKLEPGGLITGRVVDGDGEPIPDAKVDVFDWFPRAKGRARYSITGKREILTDAQGAYEVRTVPRPLKQTLVVEATAKGFGRRSVDVLADGQPGFHCTVDIALDLADQSVSGVVLDADGKLLAGMDVYTWDSEGQPDRETKTDSDGKFIINDICKGPVRLVAKVPDRLVFGDIRTSGGAQNVRIVLREPEEPDAPEPALDPPQSLMGKPFPELKVFRDRLAHQGLEGKPILVCFLDLDQRPSRRCLAELAAKAAELEKRDVLLVAVHASPMDEKALAQFKETHNVTFPLAAPAKDAEAAQELRIKWGAKSLPWLILTDREHVVRAEGFGIEELDENLEEALSGGAGPVISHAMSG